MRPRGIVECWGCGLPDASHHSQAERDACRNAVARGITVAALSHRRSLIDCACSCCRILFAARVEPKLAAKCWSS